MIKKLMGSIREYKKPTLITPVFMVGEVTCECIIPLITANLINDIKAQCSMGVIAKWGGLLILLALISLACGVAAGKFCADASTGFAKNLRHDLFYKIQGFSFSNIDSISTSSLVTRLTTDVNNVQQAFMMIIRTAVRAPLMMLFATVMSIFVGGKLAWIFVVTIPVVGGAFILIAVKAMPMFRAVFKKYDRVNNSTQENIQGMRVVKSFVREEHEKEKFNAASAELKHDFIQVERLLAWNEPIMQLAMRITMILIAVFTSMIVVQSGATKLDVGTLSSMITYSMQVLMSILFLIMIVVMVTMAIASAKRIVEVLDTESDIVNPGNAVTEIADGSIDFENVSFRYSKEAEKNALENISVHIAAGETVGIIGGTGSGKTSFIQLISRLYDVTEGCVKVGGRDVRDYDLATLRDGVSVVLQKNVLFSGTIKENLRWGNSEASDEEIKAACRQAQAAEFVESFPDGYDTYIEQGGSNVSGGQKQRLCIARALLKKPKVLILDDSTSAVDTHTDALIRKAFATEIPGTTKLIIAQRISSVQEADKIIVLENGTLNAVGTHEELLKSNEIYQEVYCSQNKGGDDE